MWHKLVNVIERIRVEEIFTLPPVCMLSRMFLVLQSLVYSK